MTKGAFSTDDPRWPITPALVWIASRSVEFVAAVGNVPPPLADVRLAEARRGRNPALRISLDPAFDLLRDEIGEGELEQDFGFLRHPDGGFHGFNEHELWHSGVTIAKAELFRLWPPLVDWEAIVGVPWQVPSGLTRKWIKVLPAGEYVLLSSVVDLLAFGKSRVPMELTEAAALAERLKAGLVVDAARRRDVLRLIGIPARREAGQPEHVRSRGALGRIAPDADGAAILLPVPYGAPDWLGPLSYIQAYAENGFAAESVSFTSVAVARDSLEEWLSDLSGKPRASKGGRRQEYSWDEIKSEAMRLMDYHGDFSADDKEWNKQARLEEALMNFCSKKYGQTPAISTLREKIPAWLEEWRSRKRMVGN